MKYRRSRWAVVMVGALAMPAPFAPAQTEPLDGAASPPASAAVPPSDALTRLAQELTTDAPAATAGVQPTSESRSLGAATSGAPKVPHVSGPNETSGSGVLGTLGALGLIVGLILAGRWAWVRFGGGVVARGSPAVEILSRTTVAPRNHVVLVRIGPRILVLGDSPAGLRALSQIEEPEEVADLLEALTAARSNSLSRGFAQLLSHSDTQFEAQGESAMPEHSVGRARDSVSGLLARMRALSQKGVGR